MGLMEWDRQQGGESEGGSGKLGLTNPDVHLQFGCGPSSEILITGPRLARECFDSWSSSSIPTGIISMKWVHLSVWWHPLFIKSRARGRNYFFDGSEIKTFSAGRAKRDKNLILRRVNEADTSTNEFQLFLIKVDVAEVKMTLHPEFSLVLGSEAWEGRVAANNKCIRSRAKEILFIFHFSRLEGRTSIGMGKELAVIFLHLKTGFHLRNSFLCKIADWTQSFLLCLRWSFRGNS